VADEPDELEYDPALQLMQDEAPAALRSWILVYKLSSMHIDAHHFSLASECKDKHVLCTAGKAAFFCPYRGLSAG
jgi:hypothetical protein